MYPNKIGNDAENTFMTDVVSCGDDEPPWDCKLETTLSLKSMSNLEGGRHME